MHTSQFYYQFFLKNIMDISGIIASISSLVQFIIIPPIFNFYIIPNIEKKIGRKINFKNQFFMNNIRSPFLCYITKNVSVSFYIVFKYFGMSKKTFERNYSYSELSEIQYESESFSRFELFFSFFSLINLSIIFIFGGILWFSQRHH